MTSDITYSWSGSPEQCADAIAAFFVDGRIEYVCPGDGPADVTRLTELKAEIQSMIGHMPKLNARWKQYVKGVLVLMQDGRYSPKPTTVASRKQIAEEEATKLRAIALHIRRQWYMKRVPEWMIPFARPAAVAQLVASATVPADVTAGPPVAAVLPRPPVAASPPPPPVPIGSSTMGLLAAALRWQAPMSAFDIDSPRDEASSIEYEPSVADSNIGSDMEVHWVYGYDTDDAGTRKSWRGAYLDDQLIAEREYASHTTTDGTTLHVAHFLDGTSSTTPGMVTVATSQAKKKRKRVGG